MELGKSPDASEQRISFTLDPSSGLPTFLQIVRQVEDAVLLGYLRVGDRLPRVKDVAERLAINPNTVLKAYAELEKRGLTEGKQGVGTFVIASPSTVDLQVFLRLRKRLAGGWLREAQDAGLGPESIVAIVRSALAAGAGSEDERGGTAMKASPA